MVVWLLSAPIACAGLYASWSMRSVPVRVPGSGERFREVEGVGPLRVSPGAEGAPSRSVLFIGNSYTYYNDMPGMLVEMAAADRGAPFRLAVQSATKGRLQLEQLAEDPAVIAALRSRRWDTVVIQERSAWATAANLVEISHRAARAWKAALQEHAGAVALFQTWAYKPDGETLRDPAMSFVGDSGSMRWAITGETPALAGLLGADAVPVGEAWARAGRELPGLELYDPDGSHPSAAGSYLTALVFYRFLTGRQPSAVTWSPAGLEAWQAAALRNVAAG